MVKHVNANQQATSQRAQQAKARLDKQRARGAKVFKNNSNTHRGASQSQSGQKVRGR